MPTYDAEKCRALIDEALRNRSAFSLDVSSALLAATQEIERLTHVQSDLAAYACKLMNERDEARKLAGEACELATLHINAREEIATGISTETGEGVTYCRDDLARLAAIRHAAGVEGKGE